MEVASSRRAVRLRDIALTQRACGSTVWRGSVCPNSIPRPPSRERMKAAACSRAQRGMAEPALDEMRRDIGLEGVDAEAVPQALGHCLRAGDACRHHDGLDVTPCRCPAPAPKAHRCKLGIMLPTTDLKMPPELFHKLGRQRDLPIHAAPAAR